MCYTKVWSFLSAVLLAGSFTAVRAQAPRGDDWSGSNPQTYWTFKRIGDVMDMGEVKTQSGSLFMSGAGADVWTAPDAFSYLYQAAGGDFSVVVPFLNGLKAPQNSYAKAGLMVRSTTDPSAAYAYFFASPRRSGLLWEARTEDNGANWDTPGNGLQPPVWLRIDRIGGVLYPMASKDGAAWQAVGLPLDANLPAGNSDAGAGIPGLAGTSLLVGIAVTGHSTAAVELPATALFGDFAAAAITNTGTLKGNITTANNLPVVGRLAFISIAAKGAYSVLTDADGAYSIVLPADTYRVAVIGAPAGDLAGGEVTLDAGETRVINFQRGPGLNLATAGGVTWEILVPATADGTRPADDPASIPAKTGFEPYTVPSGDWDTINTADNQYGWIRTKVTVPDDFVGKDLLFSGWNFDDQDWTYWNGQFLGHLTAWDAVRAYVVPGSLVRKTNDIVILGFDGGGGGGMTNDPGPSLTVLKAAGAIVGTVVDQKGASAPNVTVTVTGMGEFGPQSATYTTDATGAFAFTGLGTGDYKLATSGGIPDTKHLTDVPLAAKAGELTSYTAKLSVPEEIGRMSLRAEDLPAGQGWRFLGQAFSVDLAADRALIADNRAEYGKSDYPDTGADRFTGLEWIQDWQYVPGDSGPAGRSGDADGIPDNSDWVQRIHFTLPAALQKATSLVIGNFNVDDDVRGAYINGHELARDLTGWDTVRYFTIRANQLNPTGENVFTIVGGEGGGGAGHNNDTGGPTLVAYGLLEGGEIMSGDLNGDGRINVQDATLSLRIAVGSLQPTDTQKDAGDVNNDGRLNVQDTTLILQVAVGNRPASDLK